MFELTLAVLLGITLCITCGANPFFQWVKEDWRVTDEDYRYNDCPMKDVAIPGNDIEQLQNVDDWKKCGEACEANSECIFWEYQVDNKKCWLKDRLSYKTQQSGKFSGVRDCVKEICPMKNVEFPGNDVGSVENINEWQKCAEACVANSKCLFWEYQIDNKLCYLKSSDSTKRYSKFGKISGPRDCVSNPDFCYSCIKGACVNNQCDCDTSYWGDDCSKEWEYVSSES